MRTIHILKGGAAADIPLIPDDKQEFFFAIPTKYQDSGLSGSLLCFNLIGELPINYNVLPPAGIGKF